MTPETRAALNMDRVREIEEMLHPYSAVVNGQTVVTVEVARNLAVNLERAALAAPVATAGEVTLHVGEIRDFEAEPVGPLESTDIFLTGRGISLLVNVPANSEATFSLVVDGKPTQMGGVPLPSDPPAEKDQ